MTNERKIPEIGQTVYFGWKNTPNKVTRVESMTGSNIIAIVSLVGPRGGKSRAYVRSDGTFRKI